ncbi:MAG: Transcriptional regulator, AcrR family, partial [uncultured Pseudonocardia sp.]
WAMRRARHGGRRSCAWRWRCSPRAATTAPRPGRSPRASGCRRPGCSTTSAPSSSCWPRCWRRATSATPSTPPTRWPHSSRSCGAMRAPPSWCGCTPSPPPRPRRPGTPRTRASPPDTPACARCSPTRWATRRAPGSSSRRWTGCRCSGCSTRRSTWPPTSNCCWSASA